MVMVIAEIGCNHKGDFKLAKEMIKIAANVCNVDVVKFQKRNNKELLGIFINVPEDKTKKSFMKKQECII